MFSKYYFHPFDVFKKFHFHQFNIKHLASSPSGSFYQEGPQRLGDRNSILMMENLFRIWSGDLIGWHSSYIVLAIVLDWQTQDKHSQSPNVNTMNLQKNSQYFWNMFFFRRSIWVFLEFVHRKKQNFNIFDLEKHKIEQICIWNPMTTWLIMWRCQRWFSSSVWIFPHWGTNIYL